MTTSPQASPDDRIAALEMLNILEGYDLAKFGFGSAEHLHLFTEAKKLAFADRAQYLGDPDFVSRADRVSLMAGASWDENLRGTNAIGTALAEQRAVG